MKISAMAYGDKCQKRRKWRNRQWRRSYQKGGDGGWRRKAAGGMQRKESGENNNRGVYMAKWLKAAMAPSKAKKWRKWAAAASAAGIRKPKHRESTSAGENEMKSEEIIECQWRK
jgi:hypothetical protein